MVDMVMILSFVGFENGCCALAFFCGLVAITGGIMCTECGVYVTTWFGGREDRENSFSNSLFGLNRKTLIWVEGCIDGMCD